MPKGVYARVDAETRFWSKVRITDTCWLWTGALDRDGYGRFKYDGRTRPAHHFLFTRRVRALTPGEQLCHTCDVRRCVREDHLFAGTTLDNTQDAALKGRMPRGEGHPMVRFTGADVRDMRRRHAEGETYAAIGRSYDTALSVVRRIVLGLNWKHIF